MKKEAAIQAEMLKYLRAMPGSVWFNTIPHPQYGERGVPDILGCFRSPCVCGRPFGVFTGIEVKTETGKLYGLQEHNLDKIQIAGGMSMVVRSIEELKERIR